MMDYAVKMQKCAEYVEALEVERRKIQVFERELPLCLELVSQAIDACRQQLSSSATECSEQTSSHGPVLEFIPIKPDAAASACSSKDGADEEEDESGEKYGKKSDWLRSVQLWNQSSDPAPELKRNGGAFRPFSKDRVVAAEAVDNEPASSVTKKIRKEEIKLENDSAHRKQRRCWSPELHRRFIHALEQLGGANVATPKQIKELMKVDGLTNDEVKSHLQKYRLHMKRPSYTMSSNDNGQGSQFVVVGGIWVQPPEHAPATTSSGHKPEAYSGKNETSSPSNGVYAPVAKVGTPFARPASKAQNKNPEDRSGSHCAGSHSPHRRAQAQTQSRSSSPVSSSSTHTTATATATDSPVLS